ncbi:MAG: ribosome small subunit-dependent GTPase A [Anaerolineales bacterium]|nr:ribosome small subunit-dependent GTPase A [Anaerolineales bacterium]
MSAWLPGLVTKAQSGFFWVRTSQGDFVCRLRGRLKQVRQASDLAAVGDRVEIARQPDGTGTIEAVAPRARVLSRRAPGGYGRRGARAGAEAEQVIVANPDQVIFVFACAQPAPRLPMLDRFLVVAEANALPAVIAANKADLVTPEQATALFGLYAPLGYPVHYTSAVTGQGTAALRERVRGKLSVLAGPSGVGKSSLLNALQPGLGLKARAVSAATSKGRHTTVYPELLALDEGGYLADTPGLRALGLWDVEPEELDGYFVEIRPYVEQCAFNDCTHLNERGCAVRAAVAAGAIASSRYESYVKLRLGEEE